MSEQRIFKVPKFCRPNSLAAFSMELSEAPECKKVIIDTGLERFLTPTALIFIAKVCRERRRRYPEERVFYRGLREHKYANNLGFSEALNIKDKPYPQGAFGGKTYIPISVMQRDSLEAYAAENWVELGDAIQVKCENLARVVSQDRSDALRKLLADSFREIFRNVFEHGEVNTAVFCVQYWAKPDKVEICIADRGVGVYNSLNTSKHTKPSSDREALYFSLMPGVSSKAWRNKKKKAHQKSDWDNSGYGLFFAHQLFGELGHFFLASGSAGLLLTGKTVRDVDCSLEGTLVSMSIDLSDEKKIKSVLSKIQSEAHRVKQKLGVKSVSFQSVEAYLNGEL